MCRITNPSGPRALSLLSMLALSTALMIAPWAAAAYPRPGRVSQADLHLPKENVRSDHPSISADGRWIAYSKARRSELPIRDVWVTDTKEGRTQLISKGMHGEEAAGPPAPLFSACDVQEMTCAPSISGNGRFVAYMSSMSNIAPGDTNGMFDVFVYDRHKGTTELASVSSDGVQGTFNSYFPSINFSGRYVSFTSNAQNLVEDDTNGSADIFVRDLRKDRTVRVSVTSEGHQAFETNCLGLPRTENEDVDFVTNSLACGLFGEPRSSISYDGKTVAFESKAADLVPGDTNRLFDVFVRDLKSKKTERISVNTAGEEARVSPGFGQSEYGSRLGNANNAPNYHVGRAVSASGRFVVFNSPAPNLVPNDQNGYPDVFVHDRRSGRTTRVSVFSDGKEMCLADSGAISGNGRYVAFTGCGSLVAQSKHVGGYLYRYDLLTGEFTYNYVRAKPGTRWPAVYDNPDLDRSGSVVAALGFFEKWNGEGFAGNPNGQRTADGTGRHVFRWFLGDPVGTGGMGGSAGPRPDIDPEGVCVSGVCIPPGTALTTRDLTNDVSGLASRRGAELYGASLANRPSQGDLFAVVELEQMPELGVAGVSQPLLYGLRFRVGDRSYEVRASSRSGGTFGLFDCSQGALCVKAGDLEGGFGTTGARIVFSLPLEAIGPGGAAHLSRVRAFSALGTLEGGAIEVLDSLRLR